MSAKMSANIYAELYVCDSCGSVELELNYGEDCQNCESGKLKVTDFIPQSEVNILRTCITEQDARIEAYKQRCLDAIPKLELAKIGTSPQEYNRLCGKIEGVKLALSYLDEMMKGEPK